MKPRFRAEWVVVREELLILASCLLRPMSRNSAPCVLRNSSLEPQSQRPSGGSSHTTKLSFAYTVSQTWCYLSQHPPSSLYSAHTALPLDCSLRCHSLPNTSAFTSTVCSQLISLAKFLRQPLKHVRFTCTKSPDRHTVDRQLFTCPRTAAHTWRQKTTMRPTASLNSGKLSV